VCRNTDESDALFKEGMLDAFKVINKRIGVLVNDKYSLAKFVLFGQAAVSVRDKVLAPDVWEASDFTISSWWNLENSIYRAFQDRRQLGVTPQSVVNTLKDMHPIVKELDFTHLVSFIKDRDHFVHRSVDTHYKLDKLIEEMRAFQFKEDDPDAKLGAVLIDIVVTKADKIVESRTSQHALISSRVVNKQILNFCLGELLTIAKIIHQQDNCRHTCFTQFSPTLSTINTLTSLIIHNTRGKRLSKSPAILMLNQSTNTTVLTHTFKYTS